MIIETPLQNQVSICKTSSLTPSSSLFHVNRAIKTGAGGYPAAITKGIERCKALYENPRLFRRPGRLMRSEGRVRDIRLIITLLLLTDLRTGQIKAFTDGKLEPAKLQYIQRESGLSRWQVLRGMKSLIEQGLLKQKRRTTEKNGQYRSQAAIRGFTARFFSFIGMADPFKNEWDKRNGFVEQDHKPKPKKAKPNKKAKPTEEKPLFAGSHKPFKPDKPPGLSEAQRSRNQSKLADLIKNVF